MASEPTLFLVTTARSADCIKGLRRRCDWRLFGEKYARLASEIPQMQTVQGIPARRAADWRIMSKEENRLNFRMSPETAEKLEHWYRQDGCRSKNEFLERAAEYVRMAAEQGNPYAQYLLGKLYLSGDGVPQDKDAAYDWFQKAQAQGHEYAGFFMDRIERPEPSNVLISATRLLYHMGKIFQGSAPAPQNSGIQIDRKRLAKLRRMRIAAGHKADDHEQEQTSGTMSMSW